MATKEFGTVNIKGSYILDTDEARKKLENFKKDAESPVKVKIEDPSLKNLQASITRTKQEAVKLGEELQKAINAGDKKKATSLDSMLSSKLRQVERYETSFVQFQKKINAEVKKIEQQAAKNNASINKSTTNNVASGNVPTISKEMQEELNKLEKQKEEYKSLLSEINKVSKMAASYEDGDSISLGFKATEEAAQKLINRYYELQKAVQQAKVDSVEFASAMTEQTKIALQLYELNDKLTKRDHNNNLIKESPSFLREFVSVDEYGDSTVALAVSDFADYFDQLKETANKSIDGVKAKIAELKSTLKDASSIKQDAGSLVDTAAINEANNSIEELSQKLQSIREMSYSSGKEFAFTVDKNGLQLYIESAECVTKAADEASIAVQSLNNNLNILGHTHPDGDGLFSVADIISTIEQKLSGINMPIVALGDKIASVLNLDGVSAEVLSQVKDKLWGLSNNAPVSPKMFTEIKEIFAAGGSPDAIQTINIANGFNELSEALIKISSNAKEAQDPLEKLKNLISYYSGKKLNTDNMSSFSTYWDDFNSGAKKALEVFNEVMSQLNANTLENQDFKIDTNKTVGTSGDTADVQKINQRIDELQKIISNQQDWVKYLSDALNPDKFKTSGKKEATEQLRDLTKELVSARQENYESLSWRQYAEEILELSHARAYKEAESKNIARSNLTRYYSDAESNYEKNLKTLQEAYNWHQKTLESSQAELDVLQQKLSLTKEIKTANQQTETSKPTPQSLYDSATESVKKLIDQLLIAEQKIDTFKDKTAGVKLDNFDKFQPTDFDKSYILAAYAEIQRVQQEISSMPIIETEDDKKRLIELKEEALRLLNTLSQTHLADSTVGDYKNVYGLSDEDAFQFKTQKFGMKETYDLLEEYRSEFSKIFNEIANVDDRITNHMISNTNEWTQFRQEKLNELFVDQMNYQKALNEKLTAAANDAVRKQQEESALKSQRNNLVKDFKASFIDFGKAFKAFSPSQDDAFEDVLAGIKNGTITTVDACIQKFEELSKINFSDFIKKNVFPYIEQPSGQLSLFEGVAESANRASESVDNLKNKVQEVYTVPGQLSLFDAGAQGSIEQLGTAAANALNNSVKDTNIDDLINQAGNAADANKQKIESFGAAAQNALSVASRSDVSKVLGSSAGKQLGDLGASQTASSVDIAAEAIRSEGAAAEQAAIQKRRFADANKEVAASGRSTAKSINEAAKAVGSEGQSVERAKAYYDELYRLMNNINAKDSEILKLSGKNSDGLYTNYINDLQTQKAEMIARVREIGEQVSMEFGNSIQGAKTYSLSGARFFDEQDTANINTFLNSVQAQSVLTAQDIDKLSASFQNSKKVGLEFANQMSASMAEVNKISSNIFKIDENTGFITGAKSNIDETIQMYQNAKIAYEQLNYVKQKLSSKPEADWSAQEAALLQALIERFKEYGSVLNQTVQKEKQYFSGKTKFDASTTSIGDVSKQAEQEAQKVTEVQKKLEEAAQQFAKNSKFDGGAIVTNFEQLSNGVYSLEFACKDASGVLQTFRAEMGQASKDIYIDANQINSAFKTMSDAKKQLMSMNNLKNILDASGINTDVSTATGPLKEFLQNWQLLQDAINNPKTTSGGFAKITKDAKMSTAEVEKLYKQMMNMQSAIDRGDAMSLDEVDPTKGNVYRQMINSVQQFAAAQDAVSVSFGKFNEKAGTLEFTLNKANGSTESFKASMASLNGQMMAQSTGVGKLTSEWGRFGSIVTKAGKQLLTALVGYNVMYKAIAEVRKGIGYVKEIDLALTELKKVTDETDATYKEFLNTASRTSAEIGSTISAFTEAASNFARLGYTIEESASMAESAVVYKNVADGLNTVEESTESIISTMKAFGIGADDTMGIVDRFNEVGK